MSEVRSFAEVRVGQEIPAQTYPISRETLIRYAGAGGDFNRIHWNERFAKEVGLPDVIAHGMLTMAEVARLVTQWAGDPGCVIEYGVRFTRPIVVPDTDGGAMLQVSGVVKEVNEAERSAVVTLTATVEGQTVLARARATVRLA
jgi:acyl dehydratase